MALRGTSTYSGVVDLVLGAALLAGVPRLRMSLRRLLPSALLFAVGLGLLKTLGKLLHHADRAQPGLPTGRWHRRPAAVHIPATPVAPLRRRLAATSEHGRVEDLAGGGAPT